jgi:sortase (surface protein transpeptidase)
MTLIIKKIYTSLLKIGKVNSTLLVNIFVIIAIILLVTGLSIGVYDWRSNDVNNQRAAALINEANHNINHAVPSTIKPTASELANYIVAPTLPRYLIIPKLGVDALILPVGINVGGSLGTPDNVFNTAWYDESSKPGQKGAMLIDGHISSWTTHGVFYGLNTLLPGNIIDVQGGNGAIFTYKVVKTQVYDSNNVNMGAALSPIDPTKPGLNLISCTGKVISGTSEFNERIIVFATQS